MNLVRLGTQVINLDHVREIHFSEYGVSVRFAGIAEPLRFHGAEAEALRWYLEHTALDLLAHHTHALEAQAELEAIKARQRREALA